MIVYSDRYLDHHLEGHPENKDRLVKIMDFLKEKEVFETVPLVSPKKAGENDILRVHSKEHLENLREIGKKGVRVLGDTYFTGETFQIALLAAGGVLRCIDDNKKCGFALIRPPGHHATYNSAMGFCIFNNAAIGAAYARDKGFKRIAILDFDLHHGNGTQEIFYNDEILYISLHQWPHYPGTGAVAELGGGKGEGYNINIPLPGGVSDKSYTLALTEVVFPILKNFSPQLLITSAGYDGHFSDPLGSLRLSTKTYLNISRLVKSLSEKVIFTLEGGYNLNALPHCVYATLQGLFDLEGDLFDKEQDEDSKTTENVENKINVIRKTMAEYWAI
jgi:acetoin utilization deacetylase AcuC-like enzyme